MIDLENVEKEFDKYVDGYEQTDKIVLKKEHTKRVATLSKQIATWLAQDDNNKILITQAGRKENFINLATTIGWLHDLGRFKQAEIYDSFDDRKTFDHAQKGVEILKENNYIKKYCDEERFYDTIFIAVNNHNKLKIENGLDDFDLTQCKIIRDADKIDILKLYTERLEKFEKQDDNAKISLQMINDLKLKKQIKKEYKKSEIDKYVLALGFIFDIYYKESFRILKDLNYINMIIDSINNLVTENEKEEMEKIRVILNEEILANC